MTLSVTNAPLPREGFATGGRVPSSEETRTRILDTAIRLFRERGFDETTMRDIAGEADLALGLAYHYFRSKEALVMAYYERVQAEHSLLARERLPLARSLKDRLSMLLQTKIDTLKGDRKLLGALFRYTGNPEHALSFLGPATAPLREDCMGLFAEAIAPESWPNDLQQLMPPLFWALQMGILLYFLYDPSPDLRRTRKLIDGSVNLAVTFLRLAKLPLLRPARRNLLVLLKDANLIPQQ